MTDTSHTIEAGYDLRASLAAAGKRPLVHSADGTTSRTGLELRSRAERLAGALADYGLERGRIGLLYRNGAAALEAFIAVELLGGTRLPMDPSTPYSEARRTFDAGNVAAVLTDVPPPKTAEVAPPSILALVHNDVEPLEGSRWTRRVNVEPWKPLALFPRTFTNGRLTTIPISYANFRDSLAINRRPYADGGYGPPLRADDCYLTVVQLMYATGLVGSFPFLQSGLPQVMMPNFDAEAVLRAIETRAVTTLFGVPRMLQRIADEAERTDVGRLRTLRRVLYGGAPVTRDEIARLVEVFGPTLAQLYGRYEAGWPLTVLTPEDHQRLLAGDGEARGSCGRPVRGVELTVRQIPGGGHHGDVIARSSMSSPPYTDVNGWCDLGDVGYLTDKGYLHLTGRGDDMINSGAHHIYPGEVRDAILQTGTVSAAFVTGEPHSRWGQAVTAYVVSNDPKISEVLPRLLRSTLAPHKVPKRICRVEQLPRRKSLTVSRARPSALATSTNSARVVPVGQQVHDSGMTISAMTPDILLTTTRTVRKRLDLDRPVPLDLVTECLEIALQAPSGSNRQSWQWIVVADRERRRAIGDVYRRAVDRYLASSGSAAKLFADDPERSAIQQRVGDSVAWLGEHMGEVPVQVIPCLNTGGDLPAGNQGGLWGSLLPATWSYMLAARARGLGTAWTTLHLQYEAEVAALLELPPGVHQAALIPTAYYRGDEFSPAKRAPLASVLHLDRW